MFNSADYKRKDHESIIHSFLKEMEFIPESIFEPKAEGYSSSGSGSDPDNWLGVILNETK